MTIGEYDSAGQAIKEYVWLGDIPVAVFTPGATAGDPPVVHFVHADHLNTPRVVVDRNGAMRWRWDHAEPFGVTPPDNNPGGLGNFTFNLRFPGQYFDQESGLHYNHWRYYDPTNGGRYITPDPIGLAAGSMSLYTYVENDPLQGVDPLGLANGRMNPRAWVRGWQDVMNDRRRPGPVMICHRPIDISWIPGDLNQVLPHHHWVRTPNAEAGMGGVCPVPGQQCSDRPYSDTHVKDHTGQSSQPGAQCEPVGDDIDVQCVERLITLNRPTGSWTMLNQCQTFSYDVITACRRRR